MTDNRTTELLRCLENDWNIRASWDGLRKFWCIELTEDGVKLRDATHGTLTAEQVRKAIFNGSSYASYDGAKYYADGINMQAIADELNAELSGEVNGETSDGYHTFNELYYHRTALFACLVASQPRQMAFKSWKHSDGTMYEGFFIAGIYTSGGWCTYHCEAKWWPLFDCYEREFAPEWDGHTPSDAIHRLMSDFLPSQDVGGEVSE